MVAPKVYPKSGLHGPPASGLPTFTDVCEGASVTFSLRRSQTGPPINRLGSENPRRAIRTCILDIARVPKTGGGFERIGG
jgi:hypothetical protein